MPAQPMHLNGGAQASSMQQHSGKRRDNAPSEPHCRGSHALSINDGILCRCISGIPNMRPPKKYALYARSYYLLYRILGRITHHQKKKRKKKRVAPRQTGGCLLLSSYMLRRSRARHPPILAPCPQQRCVFFKTVSPENRFDAQSISLLSATVAQELLVPVGIKHHLQQPPPLLKPNALEYNIRLAKFCRCLPQFGVTPINSSFAPFHPQPNSCHQAQMQMRQKQGSCEQSPPLSPKKKNYQIHLINPI
ncbi:hypothetical protein J3F84DRAFT_65821 [Trichoderma pleuroticola]